MDTLRSAHLYQLIDSFLDQHDYRNLMNTNQEIFAEIKQETLNYRIVISLEIKASHFLLFSNIIRAVNDPRKQFHLELYSIPMKEVISVGLITSKLHTLEVITTEREEYNNTFDFTMFNNIPVVKLYGFNGVTKISKGLQNIKELTLGMSELEEIHDITTSGCLTKLELEECSNLRQIGSLTRNTAVSKLMFNPREKIIIEDRRLDINKLAFVQIKHVEISDPGDLDLATSFNLPSLYLNSSSAVSSSVTFFGYRLTLSRVDLASWGGVFPNIKILKLHNCIKGTSFPSMPQLERLEVSKLADLRSIPSFPNLRHLTLGNLPQLTEIRSLPRLNRLFCVDCPILLDFSVFDGQIFSVVEFESNPPLVDASAFRNAYILRLKYCRNIRRLGINNSIIPSNKRSLSLQCIPEDLSLENLYSLELHNVDLDCREIKNIAYLHLSSCSNWYNTSNLQNITHALVIENCKDLVSLAKLENIPKIALFNLPNVRDISGLRHHDHVYVSGTSYISRLALSYLEDEENSPYHSRIFRTFKGFTIIGPIDKDESNHYLCFFLGWDKINTTYLEQKRYW